MDAKAKLTGMPDRALTYSIIVPVWNEAVMLAQTAPALKRATRGHGAEIIYVLNGTTDQSAHVIASVFGDSAAILTLERASKIAALNAGDVHASLFPRFYLDADIALEEHALEILLAPLLRGAADLTAAPIQPVSEGRNWMAHEVSRIWGRLPYSQNQSYQCCIGLSAAGRTEWDVWPDIMADDLFVASRISKDRKMICKGTRTKMPMPKNLRAWIGVRGRWLKGQREFEARWSGELPKGAGQRAALAALLKSPRNWPGVWLYLFVWALAQIKARQKSKTEWFRDETIRSPK